MARGEEVGSKEESACLLMISRKAVVRCEFADNGDPLLKERRIRQAKLIH